MRNPLSKETMKKIRKDEKEFNKAEREGRVMYDSDRCIIWIFDKKDKVWKKSTSFLK